MSDIGKRFHAGWNEYMAVVMDLPHDAFNKLDGTEQNKHRLVRISIGGMISKSLAITYVEQICAQLNQFDVANATVAKLS